MWCKRLHPISILHTWWRSGSACNTSQFNQIMSRKYIISSRSGRAVAFRRRFSIQETRLQSPKNVHVISSPPVGTEAGFSFSTSAFPCQSSFHYCSTSSFTFRRVHTKPHLIHQWAGWRLLFLKVRIMKIKNVMLECYAWMLWHNVLAYKTK